MPYLVPMRLFVSVCLLLLAESGYLTRDKTNKERESWTWVAERAMFYFLFPPSPRASGWHFSWLGKACGFLKCVVFRAQTSPWSLSVYEQKGKSHEQGVISTWFDLAWIHLFLPSRGITFLQSFLCSSITLFGFDSRWLRSLSKRTLNLTYPKGPDRFLSDVP